MFELLLFFPLFTNYLPISPGMCTPVMCDFKEKSEEFALSKPQFSLKSNANPQKKLKSLS
jgi:hypothetical protein